MKHRIKKYRLELTGFVIGAGAGWVYWFFVGCSSGSCIISSKPINSMLYFAVLGVFVAGLFKKEKKNRDHEKLNRID